MGWNDHIDFADDQEFRKYYDLVSPREEENNKKTIRRKTLCSDSCVVIGEYTCQTTDKVWETFLFSVAKPFTVEGSISALTALMREEAELGGFEKVNDLANLIHKLAIGDPDAHIFWQNDNPDTTNFCWSTEGKTSPLFSYWECYEFLLDGFLYYVESEEE
jgi:hypothetical protein